MAREIRFGGPVNQIRRAEDADGEFLAVGYDHDPPLGCWIPEDFGVPELRAVAVYDGVVCVFGECVAIVEGVGNVLGFAFGRVERVDGDNAVGLVREEAGGVVRVYDCAAGEYAFGGSAGKERNGLVFPGVQVLRGRVAPMLVACYDGSGII